MSEIVLTVTIKDMEKVLERVERELGIDEANLIRAYLDRSVYTDAMECKCSTYAHKELFKECSSD